MRIRWRNLEMPSRVTVDRTTLTESYGAFSIEPFERGFGHTIGNGLRRVLLSVLEGVAVRWISVKGALHEFQAVDGVVEDVADIILQVKQLRIRVNGDGPVMLRIRKSEKGPVTAADIKAEGDATVVNKDLHICTLSKRMDFELDMEAVRGRGYVTAEEHEVGGGRYSDPAARRNAKEIDQEIGKIWVDSIFSPVLRVKYATQDTRVGKLTDYDRLMLEIWTDGSIRPEEALAEASKIYRKCLNPLVSFGALGGELPVGDPAARAVDAATSTDAMLAKPIVELALSVRAGNCLESEKIYTVGDLVARSPEELLQVRNFGKNTLTEIRQKLAELGLRLRDDDADPADDAGVDAED
ncbi:MAG TPA: DNA-directed RNA polymerase subunit alpha [Planctomycetota bacterium]|nr:DNA-directed RNA polymerase subunit alpha [Planctomycetota bacterium]